MTTSHDVDTFPASDIQTRLRNAITRLGEDLSSLREPWEPTFDSLAVVGVLAAIDSVLPGFTIAPEKVVRKGGYGTVEEAVEDITERIRRQWNGRRR